MFKLISPIAAVIVLGILLCNTLVMAQSKEEGINLFNEAKTLQDNAQSAVDLKKAVEKYEQALRIFEEVKFEKGINAVANNLGTVSWSSGQYDKAVEYYEKSLELCRKTGDMAGEGNVLNNMGNMFQDEGQYPKAVEYYEKSLELKRKTGDVRNEGQILNNLGNVFRA